MIHLVVDCVDCSQLHADRPSLPDVPAVYFVSPTSANIQRIASDLRKGLYASTYINFTSALPKHLLEEFAETVAKDGTVEGVEQVRPPPVPSFARVSLRGPLFKDARTHTGIRPTPRLPRSRPFALLARAFSLGRLPVSQHLVFLCPPTRLPARRPPDHLRETE